MQKSLKSNVAAYIEKSREDIREIETYSSLHGMNSVACYKLECKMKIPYPIAQRFRDSFMELSKHEQDLVILIISQLEVYKKHKILSSGCNDFDTLKSNNL